MEIRSQTGLLVYCRQLAFDGVHFVSMKNDYFQVDKSADMP